MSSTCRAPRAADTPGALHCRHGFINATLWTFLLSMHFSKPFHRFISFSFSSSLKSIPDGQKLFLNWPCNSSSYINPPTMSLPSARGCTLLPGRSLFPLQGGEALRAGKWSQISQALCGVGWKAGDQLQACHLVPQPSPLPPPDSPALPGSVLQDLASRRPQGAGRPGGPQYYVSQEQEAEVEVGRQDPKNKNVCLGNF